MPSPRDTQKIVEEQARRWQLDAKAFRSLAERPPEPWPLITVSREFGSLGAAMGRLVADQLGFSFWDQEIVHAIVEHTGAQEVLLASLDERSRNRIEDVIGENLGGAVGSAVEYVRQVTRVVRIIERHGIDVMNDEAAKSAGLHLLFFTQNLRLGDGRAKPPPAHHGPRVAWWILKCLFKLRERRLCLRPKG